MVGLPCAMHDAQTATIGSLQVSVSLLRANVSSLLSGREGRLVDPAEALRGATALSAVIMHASEPESSEERAEFQDLKASASINMKSVSQSVRVRRNFL